MSGYVHPTLSARQAPCHCPHGALASTYASLGPPWLRSKTCRGLRYHRKDWMILAPCGGPGESVRAGGLKWGKAHEKAVAVGSRPSEGQGVETESGLLGISGKEGWGRSLPWNLGAVAGEGRGAEPEPVPPPRLPVERGGCAYLVAPTLGVHKHQQGLHEGGRGGPDDEGSPAALLGDRETIRLFPVLKTLPPFSAVRPHTTSRSDLKWAWPYGGNSDLASHPPLGPRAQTDPPKAASAQGPQYSKKQAPLSCSPPVAHPAPGLTSGPFLLDFLLKDALFFFLLALRVFCEGSRGIGDKVGGLG